MFAADRGVSHDGRNLYVVFGPVPGLSFNFFDLTTVDLFRLESVPFILLLTAIPFLPLILVLLLVNLGLSKWLKRKQWSNGKKTFFLLCPFWIATVFFLFCTVWSMLPSQRLNWVCWGTAVKANHIQVSGMRGLQIGEWLAVFETDLTEFQKLVREQKMQGDGQGKFSEEFSRLVLIENANLCRSLNPATNAPFFYREVIGVDGVKHGGIYATYDSNTLRAVVFHTGY